VRRYLVQNSWREFTGIVGLAGTRENFADPDSDDSLEGLLGVPFDACRFHAPEWRTSAALRVFPSLTTHGRIRASTNLHPPYEVFNDLFAQVTLNLTDDRKPPSAGAEKADYTLTMSLSYPF
jgi:hypothetical protein